MSSEDRAKHCLKNEWILVLHFADVSLKIQVVSSEDRAKHCFESEWILAKQI